MSSTNLSTSDSSSSSETTGEEKLAVEEIKDDFGGGKYVGDRNHLNQRHGNGWALFPNFDQYQGQYQCGQRHGHGLYVFRNGARYLGAWRCNLKHGVGTFYYPDGSTYEGEWRKDLRHCYGIYTYENGERYEGSWYKGQRHGIGRYVFNGKEAEYYGMWQHGIRPTGGVGEIICKNYRFHGNWSADKNCFLGPGVFAFNMQTMLLGYSLYDEAEQTSKWNSQDIIKYDGLKLPVDLLPPAAPMSDSSMDECECEPNFSDADNEISMEHFDEKGQSVDEHSEGYLL